MLYDTLIIGSGLAGLSAAIKSAESGVKTAIVTKTNPLRSNSSMAAGGINASLATMEADTTDAHVEDTVRGADGLADKDAVKILCEGGPKAIKFLQSVGVEFDTQDNGKLIQRSFGGAGKKRTCYIADKTGGAIVQALLKRARALKVEFLIDRYLLSILESDGKVSGATIYNKNTGLVEILGAKALVLAGGGYAGIYRGHTSNPTDSCGDIVSAALRAGLRLSDMEFVQFHPTGLARSGSLVSEAARGEGGRLVNSDGERFVNELSTRDVISRAIALELMEGKEVFIDVRHLGEDIINAKLPSFRKAAISTEGLDPANALIPIKPVAHYTMGGIEAQTDTSTTIDGLFACGECASIGMHGANRLGGNSLLDGVVFGSIAGKMACRFASEHDFSSINLKQVAKDTKMIDFIFGDENRYNIQSLRKSLGDMMYKNVGIFRNEEGLSTALEYIGYLRGLTGALHTIEKVRAGNFEMQQILEFRNSLDIAEAVVYGAMARRESRGAHSREDFPSKSSEFAKRAFVSMKNRSYRLEFESIGKSAKFLQKIINLIKGR